MYIVVTSVLGCCCSKYSNSREVYAVFYAIPNPFLLNKLHVCVNQVLQFIVCNDSHLCSDSWFLNLCFVSNAMNSFLSDTFTLRLYLARDNLCYRNEFVDELCP